MTHRIRRLLAATDFSKPANESTRRAAQIARQHGASLELVHAFEAPAVMPAWGDPGGGAWVNEQSIIDGAARRLDRARESLAEAYGITVSAELLIGSVHRQIAKHADSLGADLVVLGAHGETGLVGRLLGSTTGKVLRQCRRPMLVVRRPAGEDYARVILATDFSEIAHAAAQVAATLCPKATFWLVHSFEPRAEWQLAYARIDAALSERYLKSVKDEAQRSLGAAAETLAAEGIRTSAVLREGDPADQMSRMIESVECDLLSIGTQGKSRLEAGLLGSVSQHAVAEAACDVLVTPASA